MSHNYGCAICGSDHKEKDCDMRPRKKMTPSVAISFVESYLIPHYKEQDFTEAEAALKIVVQKAKDYEETRRVQHESSETCSCRYGSRCGYAVDKEKGLL